MTLGALLNWLLRPVGMGDEGGEVYGQQGSMIFKAHVTFLPCTLANSRGLGPMPWVLLSPHIMPRPSG